MDGKSPVMSTPKKGRYSSLFKELARLPSILFGHYSRDACDLLRFDTPNKSFLSTLDASPCRHSPRLLSNGYYEFEEDSYNTDDEGNLSFSPTKCTISYKENIVRVFRRRRRPHAQRTLDLSNYENQEGWRPTLGEDLGDCEPLDFIQTFNNYTGSLPLSHGSESRTLIPVISSPSTAEVEEIPEGSSVYGSMEGHSCIDKGNNTFSEDTKNLIPAERKTIPLSLIGCVEEISGEEPGKARQEINICIAVLYCCIFVFLIFLCARFWTSALFPSLFAMLLSSAYILFPVSRGSRVLNHNREDT